MSPARSAGDGQRLKISAKDRMLIDYVTSPPHVNYISWSNVASITMNTRGERLKLARKRLFKSARTAAKDLGVPPATYGAHERAEAPNGRGRDYGPDEARIYGARFGVKPQWLLTGEGLPDAEWAEVPQELLQRLDRLVSALERNTVALEKILQSGQVRSFGARLANVVSLVEERARREAAERPERQVSEGEPTMKEILDSIRKIIAEDEASVAEEPLFLPVFDTLRWLAQNPGLVQELNRNTALHILAGDKSEYFKAKVADALDLIAAGKSIEDLIFDIQRGLLDEREKASSQLQPVHRTAG
jgi:hypothetical protein